MWLDGGLEVRRCLLLLLICLGFSTQGHAQAELDGNFIDYVGTGFTGSLVNIAGRSMRYSESGADPYSCDAFRPGDVIEDFQIEAMGDAPILVKNGFSLAEITPIGVPSVAGNTIEWNGSYTSGNDGVSLRQRVELRDAERVVLVTIDVTNTGSSTLNNLYYARTSDADHGQCSIGNDFRTENDVLRQRPVDQSALVVARALSTETYILGLGSFDDDVRAHSAGALNSIPSGVYATPEDPNGAYQDWAMSLVFHRASLAPGESTTMRYAFVWALSDETLQNRFEAVECLLKVEGDSCSAGGSGGTCRSGACCTGCWDGAACLAGDQVGSCGLGGVACATCSDGSDCTADTCNAGVCSYPLEPVDSICDDGLFCTDNDRCDGSGTCAGSLRTCSDGLSCTSDTCDENLDRCENVLMADHCMVDGLCLMDGEANPANGCEICDSDAQTAAWSFAPNTRACDDGLFCTTNDRCDGVGSCSGSARSCTDAADCTFDSCNEALDRCEHVVVGMADTCAINGMCIPAGQLNPLNPCEICDPLRSLSTYSAASAGGSCDDGLFCTENDICDGAGACVGAPRSCDDGISCTDDECNEVMGRCESQMQVGQCLIDGNCVADGENNPANECELCDAGDASDRWSAASAGTLCTDDGILCTDNVCDGLGVCSAQPSLCDDGLSCTSDSCDPVTGCGSTVNVGMCLIEGACYSDGDEHPDNPCLICNASSPSTWSMKSEGASCTPNSFCGIAGVCDAAGVCGSTMVRDCDDGLDCTVDRCDAMLDACAHDVAADFCAIHGECVPRAQRNDDDDCAFCDPDNSVTNWSYDWNEPTCDSDGDCIPDGVERAGGNQDSDMDGTVDYLDPDDDGDSIPTRIERGDNCMDLDSDSDEIADYLDSDDDDDCVPSIDEVRSGMDIDTDMDGDVDRLDIDDDNDTILSCDEYNDGLVHGHDVDSDSELNWRDIESDGDGVPDMNEGRGDNDSDGVPNYLDPNSIGQTDAGMDAGADAGVDAMVGDGGLDSSVGDPSGLAGGSCNCRVASSRDVASFFFLTFFVALLRRRR